MKTWELTGLLITGVLSFTLRPKATGCTKPASLQSPAKGEKSPLFERAPVHTAQFMKEHKKWDSSILIGYTEPRCFWSPKHTKGPFQIQATKKKKKKVGVKLGQERAPKDCIQSVYGDHIFKASCGFFDSITSILRDIKPQTLHLSGAVP